MRSSDPRWVLLFALVLFGWNVWGYDLWAPDEPFFAEGAREMMVDGEWLVPHVNGQVNTHKPPLFFWLIALFSLPLGEITSLTARLPSILAALGSVFLVWRLGRRLSGPRTGALAAAMLVTTHIFWDKARFAQIDALLCFLILVAVSAFETFRAGDARGRRAGLLFWVAAALAVLAKGPVGLLLPLGIALGTLAWDGESRRWRAFAPLLGPLAFAAVAGSWAAATMVWGGEYSVLGALRLHFVDRAIHGMHHEQPVWYYLKVLPYALFPWSFLLPGALLLAWRRRGEPAERLLLVWSLFVIFVFTVSTEKRDLYILPAVPALTLLSARLVAAVVGWWRSVGEARVPGQRWVTGPQGAVGALLLAAAPAAVLAAPRYDAALRGPATALAAVLAVGGGAVLWAALRGRALRAVVFSGGAMAAMLLVAVSFVYPALDPAKSGRELAGVVRETTAASRAAGHPVFGFELINVPRAVNFYSNGVYLKNVEEPARLLSELSAEDEEVYLLADEAMLPPFPERLRRRMRVVYETRLSRKDLVLLRFAPAQPAPASSSLPPPLASPPPRQP